MPITDAMRRDKAIFFSKISLICITIGITIFINRYTSDRCFHSCVILRERGRGGVCSSIFNFRFLSCCPNVSPLSPNLSTLLVGRDLSFPGIFEIHKVISRLRRSIVIRFYPRRRLKIFHGTTFLGSNKCIDRFIFEANSYRLNSCFMT